MTKLVSVIIPVYNKEKYLEKSLLSVLNQTYRNLEIILVNDGSQDNSENIIHQYEQLDNRIVSISLKNGGVSKARNTGIRAAKGDYIAFLDADDFYELSFVEQMVQHIASANICYCGCKLVFENNTQKNAKMKFKENDIIVDYFLNRTTPNTNCWLFKRQFLIENESLFNEELDWGEDMLLFAQILTLDMHVKCAKEYLTNYHVGIPHSLSTNDINKLEKDIVWIDLYKQFLEGIHVDESRKKKIIQAIDGYRIPALIIYRLYANRPYISNEVYAKYEKYVNQFTFNNGLRSLKLWLFKLSLNKSKG